MRTINRLALTLLVSVFAGMLVIAWVPGHPLAAVTAGSATGFIVAVFAWESLGHPPT